MRGASFGLRFCGSSWWRCRSKQRPGQGAGTVAELGGPWREGRSWGALGPCFSIRTLSQWPRIYWRWLECKYSLPLDRWGD